MQLITSQDKKDQDGKTNVYMGCLDVLDPQQQEDADAAPFTKTSCEYEPVNISKLPARVSECQQLKKQVPKQS